MHSCLKLHWNQFFALKICWQFAYLDFISKIKLDQHVLYLCLPQPFYQGWNGNKSFHLLFIKGKTTNVMSWSLKWKFGWKLIAGTYGNVFCCYWFFAVAVPGKLRSLHYETTIFITILKSFRYLLHCLWKSTHFIIYVYETTFNITFIKVKKIFVK